jgi:hypothetical protein
MAEADQCPECGAPLPPAGSCRDNFHALLLLEAEIPGVAGSILHFYAVAAYGLQHPDSMNYSADALSGLAASLADVLDGRVTMDDLKRRTRRAADGPTRVTRRARDEAVPWRRGGWPMTIAQVCTADTFGTFDTYEAYADRLVTWARSVRESLAADGK